MVMAAALFCSPVDIAAKSRKGRRAPERTVSTVKKEQTSTKKSIQETTRRIEENKKKTGRELDRLNSIRAEIDRTSQSIAGQQQLVDSIDRAIAGINSSMKALDERLVALRAGYARRLRAVQPSVRPLGRLSYIFSGKSVREMYQRMRYVREFNRWTKRQSEMVEEVAARLQQQRAELAALDADRRSTLASLRFAQSKLAASETSSRQIVAGLQRDAGELKRELNERRRRSAALDNELDRLIEADRARRRAEAERKRQAKAAAKPAAKATPAATAAGTASRPATKSAPAVKRPANDVAASAGASSFAAARGRLIFPLSGNYSVVRKFGRQKHPDLPNVMIDNSGIDVETASGAGVRAVYDGVVSAVFEQPGFHTILMVRHGDYLTIYGGLGSIAVKKGDKVKTGQSMGRLFADGSGKSILHFEVRHEREKLNPLSWVK